MKVQVKIPQALLADIRLDLRRSHAFAHERVGFLTAGAAVVPSGGIVLLAREYRGVSDNDYEPGHGVGAHIGADAMRKALQAAYRPASALLHIHSHGGSGRPAFSHVDLRSAEMFVPSFFNAIPKMPHGIVVLSNDSACGLIWTDPKKEGQYIHSFVGVGAALKRYGELNV